MTNLAQNNPIKSYRQAKHLTLKEFGELFTEPYHKTTILRWERGEVPTDIRTILEIEKVTGIPRTRLAPDFFDFTTLPEAVGQ